MDDQLKSAAGDLVAEIEAAGHDAARVADGVVDAVRGIPRGLESRHVVWVEGETVRLYTRAALAAKYRQRGDLRTAASLGREQRGCVGVLVDFGAPKVLASTPNRLALLAAAMRTALREVAS
jgi:hypothetical protein